MLDEVSKRLVDEVADVAAKVGDGGIVERLPHELEILALFDRCRRGMSVAHRARFAHRRARGAGRRSNAKRFLQPRPPPEATKVQSSALDALRPGPEPPSARRGSRDPRGVGSPPLGAGVAERRQCPTPAAKTPKSNNKQANAEIRRTSNLRRAPLDDLAHTNPTMLAAAATAPMTT